MMEEQYKEEIRMLYMQGVPIENLSRWLRKSPNAIKLILGKYYGE